MKGQTSRVNSMVKQKKLSKWEAEVLIECILDIDAWGFLYRVSNVADIANVLIDEDTCVDCDHVGKN